MPASSLSVRLRWWLGLAAVAAPAALYLRVLAHYAINVPRSDDYYSILPFLRHWTAASTLPQRLPLLWVQYFSHRIVLTRCVVLLQWLLLGRCDFLQLQVAGWIGWVALTGAFIFWAPAARRSPWLGLPLALWLMQPQGSTNLDVAMQAVQNIGVVVLAWAAFAAVRAPGRGALLAALGFALLAALTSVNGLLVGPVAAVALWRDRHRRRALVCAGVGAAAGLAYFLGYSFATTRFDLGRFLANAGAMAGGFANLGHFPLAWLIRGGLLLLALAGACLLEGRVWRLLPLHASFLLFCLASIALAAAGRLDSDPDYMLQDRYRLYGLFVAGGLFLLAVEAATASGRRILAVIGTALGAMFCLLSYARGLPALATDLRWCQATAMNWQLGQAFPLFSTDGWAQAAAELAPAEKSGIYRLPVLLTPPDLEAVRALARESAAGTVPCQVLPNGGLCGYLLTPVPSAAPAPWAVVALGNGALILPRPALPARLPDLAAGRGFFTTAVSYLLPQSVYAAGPHPVAGVAFAPSGLDVLWRGRADLPVSLPGGRSL